MSAARDPCIEQAIRQLLTPELRDYVEPRLAAAAKAMERRARFEARDRVIREAFAEFYNEMSASKAAYAMSRELARAALCARHDDRSTGKFVALCKILDANEGSALSKSKIYEILTAFQTPPLSSF